MTNCFNNNLKCAMDVAATDFITLYGTAMYKPPELFDTCYAHGYSAQKLIQGHIQGSDKADSYALGLVIASMVWQGCCLNVGINTM